jgi:DNA ligase-1
MIFEKRIKKIEEVIEKANSPYLVAHKHEVCNGTEHLIEALRDVEEEKGEGMMLRDPKSYYENRRSKSLLKVKTFHDDEAVVLGHEKGTGRCAGMVGALRCKNKLGVEFSVGSGMNDEIRKHPPKIGSTITYKY